MGRFYFHQLRDGAKIIDVEGTDFPNLGAARKEAICSARDIMSDRIMRGEDPDHSCFEISDEAGDVLMIVDFREAYSKPLFDR